MTAPAHPVCIRAGLASTAMLLRLLRPVAAFIILMAPLAITSPLHAAQQSIVQSHPYALHVEEAATRFGIPENWIWAVMRQESGGNARATSRVGAQGLMQIMPGTWAMLTARYSLGSNAYDVRANINAGAAYLRMMWDRYRDVRLMLAAYNAGPGRVDAYASRQRGLPAETVNYVSRIAPSPGTSGIASHAPVPSPDAQSWRSASLFITREDDKEAAPGAPSTVRPIRTASSTNATYSKQQPASSNPLFFDVASSSE